MAEIGGYRELEAWQIGLDLVIEGYLVSERFPNEERYGLTSQLRKALVSVPSNIAEGHARRSPRATLNHLGIALGSLAEADTQMEVALRRRYVSATSLTRFYALIESSRRLTAGLRRAKRAKLAMAICTPVVVVLLFVRLLT
jgi:four helix bundle protein